MSAKWLWSRRRSIGSRYGSNWKGKCQLYLAQAQSNRGPRGRKRDFVDGERLVRRQMAGELILSFVPDGEQRLWRIMSRSKYQLRRDRVRLHNQLEAFLEEARIKLSGCVSDLLGISSRRILEALSKGESDLQKLAAMVDANLRATPEQLQDALQGAKHLRKPHRQVLGLFLGQVLGLFLARLKLIAEADRGADRGTEQQSGTVLAPIQRCRGPLGRDARLGCRFGAAGDC